MRTDQARPVRLQDYRPSPWLIDKVDLDIALHPTATRVRARLSIRPNPTASGPAPLTGSRCPRALMRRRPTA